ncbi:TPA: DUF1737 domain-containing protein [Escherichia coli]|nr:DUF1737 domain-containing protein [Escherichia coli]HBA9459974.1 DUF1737 domain-containing protein [Escherichia coli]
MTFKHYDVVRAASPSDLAERLTEKLKQGWQPFGSPVAITPYTLMQAIAAEGDVTTPVVIPGGNNSDAVATEPEYYYVVALAGQSNGMAYSEGLPLPDSYDRPDPRIKQLARRGTVTPGGAACAYNDVIQADHCLHDVQDMSGLNHPKADLSRGQYGTVGHGLHIARKLLPFIPRNAGILLVPCCRGGSGMTFGNEGTFSEASGVSADAERWGAGKPLYQDLVSRTKAALEKNPKNVLLAVVWMQGEGDLNKQTYTQHPAQFDAMVQQFRTDLAGQASRCNGGSADTVPWICGDTTHYWKTTYGTQYEAVYGAYRGREAQNIFFVPLMTDESGVNTPTNSPAEDPDIVAVGYYGAASRTQGNFVSTQRESHFSSWARRGIISDRLATAILIHAGRSRDFISGEVTPGNSTQPETPSQADGETPPQNTETGFSFLASAGAPDAQGWTFEGGNAVQESVEGQAVLRLSHTDNSIWSLTHDTGTGMAASLLADGGTVSCRFRLPDALVANQFAFALYCRIPQGELPEGVSLVDSTLSGTTPHLLAFFVSTDTANLNVMHHRNKGVKLGSFGAFTSDWHTLAFEFAGNNSTQVTPVLDGNRGTPFELANSPAETEENEFVMSGVTVNPTSTVQLDFVKVTVNTPGAGEG